MSQRNLLVFFVAFCRGRGPSFGVTEMDFGGLKTTAREVILWRVM